MTYDKKTAIIISVGSTKTDIRKAKGYKYYRRISTLKEYLQMFNKMKNFFGKTKKARRNFIVGLIIAAVCISSVAATASVAYNVNLVVDGEEKVITTLRSTLEGVLEQAEIVLDDNDVIDAKGFTAWQDSKVVITRNAEVTIKDGDKEAVTVVASGKVADALKKANITVQEDDDINFDEDDKLDEGMSIEIVRAFTVTLVVGDQVKAIKITGGTVSDALKKAGIELTEDQKMLQKLTDELKPYMIIEILDRNTTQRVVNEKIAFKTIKKNTDTLEKGTTKVTQKGVEGEKKCRYLDTYENGKVIKSELILERVIKEPVDEIVLVGTKVVTTKKPTTTKKQTTNNGNSGDKVSAPAGTKFAKNVKAKSELTVPSDLTLNSKNVPTSYKYKITGKATAYYAPRGAITATGRTVKPGHVAVDPREIPYGSKLWIVGTSGYVYGYSVAADTGGFIYSTNYLVDLFFWSYNECIQWGLRDVTIYVL